MSLKALYEKLTSAPQNHATELNFQLAVSFSYIINENRAISWKSKKMNDGSFPHGDPDSFVVGIDTPMGQFTIPFKNQFWDQFDCIALPKAKPHDGHGPFDIIRILSLQNVPKGSIELNSDDQIMDADAGSTSVNKLRKMIYALYLATDVKKEQLKTYDPSLHYETIKDINDLIDAQMKSGKLDSLYEFMSQNGFFDFHAIEHALKKMIH